MFTLAIFAYCKDHITLHFVLVLSLFSCMSKLSVGTLLLSGDAGGSVSVWNMDKGQVVQKLVAHKGLFCFCCFICPVFVEKKSMLEIEEDILCG